jgi:hypothetical protein
VTRRLLAVLAALAVCTSLAPGAGAKPPSFKRWAVHFAERQVEVLVRPLELCSPPYVAHDLEAGACQSTHILRAWPRIDAELRRGTTAVSRGQTPRCRTAIRSYRDAEHRNGAALLAYARGHRHVTSRAMAEAFGLAPYPALQRAAVATMNRALRICG